MNYSHSSSYHDYLSFDDSHTYSSVHSQHSQHSHSPSASYPSSSYSSNGGIHGDISKQVSPQEADRQRSMKPVSSSLQAFCSTMPDDVRKRVLTDRHIKKVHDQFAEIVDPFILDHVNSVYLFKSKVQEDARDLVVYLDNSTCAAELNARRELIRLKYRERFNLMIDVFEIRISRGSYRDNYPFRNRVSPEEKIFERELTSEDQRCIDEITASLPDGKLKDSFQRALSSQKRHIPEE